MLDLAAGSWKATQRGVSGNDMQVRYEFVWYCSTRQWHILKVTDLEYVHQVLSVKI